MSGLQQYEAFNDWKTYSGESDARIAKAVRYIRKSKGNRLLDVGGGNQGIGDYLSDTWQCATLDIVDGADIIRDIDEPWLVDERFDVIFCGEVIEHAMDTRHFLSELRRCLSEEGVAVLTTPNLASWRNRLRLLFGRQPHHTDHMYHYHIYAKKHLDGLLESCGFRILESCSSGLVFTFRGGVLLRGFGMWLGEVFPSLGHHLVYRLEKKEVSK